MHHDNQQILINSLPSGKLSADNYRPTSAPIPVIGDGEILVKTTAFLLSAGSRAGLQGSASYAGAPSAGRVMNSSGVGEVISSQCRDVPVGRYVQVPTGWQQFSAHSGYDATVIPADHNPIDYLGPLGINGLTAYFGLLDVAQIQAGENVMVSAAAGSVGHLVGQIATLKGAHVVGICGSNAKAERLVSELGFRTAVNYKSGHYRDQLKTATPNGVDIYFDNTGGMILGSALFRMNLRGRIACCGVVSQYDTDRPEPAPKGIPGLLVNKRLTMRGFLVYDYAQRFNEARNELQGWLARNELISLTDEVYGLDSAPEAFVDLLGGGNIGTRIVRLDQAT
ncbi:MAG TPA: NADP-dependent oxidoreductase [Porticoccaceae bacterium]|nr:NADP-dependent oxidoreductase [Porticoccaceae bacterium]